MSTVIDYSFESAEFDNFSLLVCRDIGSSLENQKDRSWAGCLSQTSAEKESTISAVEFMAPFNESINENSTVQYI